MSVSSDITPAWYSTITYPGQAFQAMGRKQLTDRENRAYLRCAQRDHPIEESPVGLWAGSFNQTITLSWLEQRLSN